VGETVGHNGLVARAGVVACLALTVACGRSATPTSPTTAPPPAALGALACPAPVAVTTVDTSAAAAFDLPAAQGGEAPVAVACTPPSGQRFPLGTTEVRCTATDRLGQTASCTFTISVSRLPVLRKTRFLAFGDSVTVGIVATENPSRDPFYLLRPVPEAAYPTVLGQLLASRYGTQQTTVVNAGKGGEKAADAVGRASNEIRGNRPDVLLLLDGYNDVGAGDAGIQPGLAGINEIVKIARFQGAQVFIATLTPPNLRATRGLSGALVGAFNQGLRDIARGENAVLVDVYEAMASDPNRYNSDDGRHPNEAGYRKIAETFFEVIQAELEDGVRGSAGPR
jgi:lysophospholipase L1-like esterase